MGAAINSALAQRATEAAANGNTPVFVVVDGQAAALAVLGDRVREDAASTLDAIRRDGWRVGMLSGDHPGVVAAVAGALRIAPQDAVGEASPEDKVSRVREAPAQATVVMVGDGVNGAAALAAADVGIAVHGGAEASLAAADIYLSQPASPASKTSSTPAREPCTSSAAASTSRPSQHHSRWPGPRRNDEPHPRRARHARQFAHGHHHRAALAYL